MGPWITALFFSAGASAWIFSKLQRHLGGSNTKQAGIVAVIAFFFILFISYYIFNLFL